jgi:hypothetical protein
LILTYASLLRVPEVDLRRKAVEVIAGLGRDAGAAVPALLELLGDKEGDEEFKAVVRSAIDRLSK